MKQFKSKATIISLEQTSHQDMISDGDKNNVEWSEYMASVVTTVFHANIYKQ